MARRPNEEDELGLLREKLARSEDENRHLTEKLTEMTEQFERIQDMPNLGAGLLRHEILILILVVVLLARVAIFAFAPSPRMITTIVNAIFGIAGAAVFIQWIQASWTVERWMTVARGAVIVTGLFIAASQCSGGTFWLSEGGDGPEPMKAAGVLLASLAAGASPICRLSMNYALRLMDRLMTMSRKKGEV